VLTKLHAANYYQQLANNNNGVLIRSCLSDYALSMISAPFEPRDVDTGMHICFLGTGATKPTTMRGQPATVVELGGKTLLFDVGEGFQRQLNFSSLTLTDVTDIFITHMHADHVMGLPGLLLHLDQVTRSEGWIPRPEPLRIYGPPGLYNFIMMNLALMCSRFQSRLPIIVHELVGGSTFNYKKMIPATNSYPEAYALFPSIKRIPLELQSDGTWHLQDPITITQPLLEETLRQSKDRRTRLPNDYSAGREKQLSIRAAEVVHSPNVPTFGFRVSEMDPPSHIDPEKAKKLGVRPGPKYNILKNGFPVPTDQDPNVMVQPEQVLVSSKRRGRTLALVGDNSYIPPPMAKLCLNVDILIHEATCINRDLRDAQRRGHSTAAMAGAFAAQVKAKLLLLYHISAANQGIQEAKEAARANRGVSRVLTAHDFMELLVPRGGYDFGNDWSTTRD